MIMMSFWPSESNHKMNQTLKLKQQHQTPHILPGHMRMGTYSTTIATNVIINKKSQGEQNVTRPIHPKSASGIYLHSLHNQPQPSEQDYEAARTNGGRRRAIK
jgi:hypothetical protein